MIETFDVISYLRDKQIPYSTSGKNVASGWVGVQCVFCEDRTNHLGINLTTRMLHCWKCGPHGAVSNYIKEYEQCSWHKAQDIIKEYQDTTFKVLQKDIRERTAVLTPPPGLTGTPPDLHRKYLLTRKFDPEYLTRKYNLWFVNEKRLPDEYPGDWRYRVVAPVFLKGQLVNFIGMDVVRSGGRPKYVNCSNEIAVRPMKECLYNIDSVQDKVIICEGITDVWRVGDGAVAVMGIVYTKEQVSLLVNRGVTHAFVMFDADNAAQKRAAKLAVDLSGVIKHVEIIDLEEGDPADLSNEKIFEIRKILLDT